MANTSVKSLSVLVLGDGPEGAELAEWIVPVDASGIKPHVECVSSFEDALEALRRRSFDFVISRTQDFLPFKDVRAARQAEAIIESVGQAVAIVGEDGVMEWANPKMLSYDQEVRDRVSQCCTETFKWAISEVAGGASQVRGRSFGFTTPDNEVFEVSATPVLDLNERVTQVAAVVLNTTQSRRLQGKIDAIDRAGRELLSLDVDQISRLDAQDRLALLEQKIIRCTKELLNFDNFEIRILDKETKDLRLVLSSGVPEKQHEITLAASPEGNGICGFVASSGRSYICHDTAQDNRYLPCVEHARSSLTVPLHLHDEVVGVANFESTEPAAFNEDARQFAEIFARYIALSLHVLELLVWERQTTTGKLGNDVMAEITGPLNDILTDVEGLVEDYIGHDDLRHRLRKISENAVRIRESVKEVTAPKRGIFGIEANRKKAVDPVLEGMRILIADDEDTIRDTVRDVLTAYGCEVAAVSDGYQAVELLARKPFDLVLSDIRMPGKNGYEVFAAAKEANPETPVILTTGFGYDPNHAIVRARREGLAAVLFKPFKVDQLLSELRMALGSDPE
ncbi:MAG: response regulator [Phycisphaerae bacterium]